jgi:hypothetical protein
LHESLDVGVLDVSTNDVPAAIYSPDVYDAVILLAKRAPGADGQGGTEVCVNKLGQTVWMHLLPFGDDVGAEEQELLDDIGDEALQPTPSMAAVTAFALKLIGSPTKALVKRAEALDDLWEDLTYCTAAASVLLPSLGTRLRVEWPAETRANPVHLPFAEDSDVSRSVEQLRASTLALHDMLLTVPFPVGRRLPGSDTTPVSLSAAAKQLGELKGSLEAAVQLINPATQSFLRARLVLERTHKLLTRFPDVALAMLAAPLKGLAEAYLTLLAQTGLFLTLAPPATAPSSRASCPP